METLKIKCPCCGAVLSVKNQAGLETKNVTCPVCKEKSPFRKFSLLKAASPAPQPKKDAESTSFVDSTPGGSGENQVMGQLEVITPLNMSFQLKLGKNVIGRKAKGSASDLQIPDSANKLMSREHLVIEVKKVPGKGYVHYASLFKERVNETFINNARLEYGDCIVLNSGDVLKLPDCNIKFLIPQE